MSSAPHPSVAVIVVAAGSGTRLGLDVPKAFAPLAGSTVLGHALDAVAGMREPVQLVVVAPADHLVEAERIVAARGTVVAGGTTRQASVAVGIGALHPSIDVVLVHDAARALAPAALFDAVVAEVRASDAGIVPGLPVVDTIKRVADDGLILATVDRSQLAAVQTPQGFPRAALAAAYATVAADGSADLADFTDDAALFAASGESCRVIPGDDRATKITTPRDLADAERALAKREGGGAGAERTVRAEARASVPALRTGIGIDVHAFDGTCELWLAGLHWPGEVGLSGHSDGDPVAHAICDALLSAAGLGDIGGSFGTDDPRFAGAHGEVFLTATRELVEAAGFRVVNVAVQLVGNRPKFAPRRLEAQALLSSYVGAPVSVAATTSDGLGFTGRGEGVQAVATALLSGPEPSAAERRVTPASRDGLDP